MALNPTQPQQRAQIEIRLPAFLSNITVLQTIAQIVFVVLLVSAIALLWTNISTTLAERNLVPSFSFLNTRANFDISEKPDWYTPNSTYGEAFLVGIINTLRVVSVGLVLATIIGVLLGIFLLSRNWLIRTLSRVYVEVLRNTPLLVQLIFWYFVVMFSLPLEDLTVPGEGIFVVPLRLFAYPLVLVVAWVGMRREWFFRRAMSGVVLGIVMVEIGHALFSDQLVTSLLIGLAGLAALLVMRADPFEMERPTRGAIQGVGLAAVSAGLAAMLAAVLVSVGVLQAPALWGEVQPAIYISRRSFVFPEFVATGTFTAWLGFLLAGVIVGFVTYRLIVRDNERTGKLSPALPLGVLVFIGVGLIGWVVLSALPEPTEATIRGETVDVATAREEGRIGFYDEATISTSPFLVSLPERGRFRFNIGTVISPEYMALLIGLVVYTSAFIGEIVRAGIQAVPYGQLEASRALGLTMPQTLRLVILPQALRLIIPPLGNQYLNLSKNSSLAIAVAYADIYQIGTTMMNQSGQSVTGFVMILLTYLTMSLVISAFMNIVNGRFQLVTR